MTLVLAAVFAFSACGGSQDTADITPVSESSGEGSTEESKEAAEETKEESKAASEASSAASSDSSASEEKSEPAEAEPEELQAGLYHLVGMTQEDEIMSTADLAAMAEMGFEMFIELRDDGTGVLNLYGETTEITWDEKGITANDETINYEWDGKYLVLTDDSTSITFSSMTAQEVIDAGEGVEGNMSFFEGDEEGEGAGFTSEATVDVNIVGAEWTKDFEDKDVLVVWFDMTNISEDYVYAAWDAYTTVTQDGAELDDAYLDKEEIPEYAFLYKTVRPGVTVRCANAYLANKDGGKIEYKITSGFYDAEVLSAEFDPAGLMGAPADQFELAKVEEIDWLDGAVESGTYNGIAEVSFKDSEILEDLRGRKILRVWFTYKNVGEEVQSFFMSVNLRAIQDGVSLDNGYVSFEDEYADLKTTDVEPGGSLDVCVDYELLSDSPVSVEFINYGGEESFIAKAFDVK